LFNKAKSVKNLLEKPLNYSKGDARRATRRTAVQCLARGRTASGKKITNSTGEKPCKVKGDKTRGVSVLTKGRGRKKTCNQKQ